MNTSRDVVEQGELIQRDEDQFHKVEFSIKSLNATYFDDAIILQNTAASIMKDKYRPVPESMISESLKQGNSLGLFVKNKIVGMRLVYEREISAVAAKCLKIPENERNECIYGCGVVILPQYSGNKLGLRMTNHIISILDISKHYHIYTTVHPENYPNLKNLMNSGLVIKNCDRYYDNKIRFLMHRDLRHTLNYSPTRTHLIRSNDIKFNQKTIKEV